jgi:peptidoglycan/LPS O-acetylase OafA/YrhL
VVKARFRNFSIGAFFLAGILIMLPNVFALLSLPGRMIAMTGFTLQAAGLALLLLQSICFPEYPLYRWLNRSIVRHVGILSYSIYIWQQIFFTSPAQFGLKPVWWLAFPGSLVAIFVVAHASYYGLERPFLMLRARFRDRKRQPDADSLSGAARIETAHSGVSSQRLP